MPYNISEDITYKLYGEVAISHAKVDIPYGMPHPHFHQDYELFFLVDGGRKFFLSNTICSLSSQTAMLIKPNEPHQSTVNLNSPLERYAIYISPKLMGNIIKENKGLEEFLKIRRFQISENNFYKIIDLINQIEVQLNVQDSYSVHHLKNLIVNIIILLLRETNNHNENKNNSSSFFEKNDIRIQAPINYILEHYAEQITLSECADIAYMSTSHFSRQFHLVTGMNFKEYLNKVRIEKACEFLKSDKKYNITELTQLVGFTNSCYFSYVFRLITGLSPTEYKKIHNQK